MSYLSDVIIQMGTLPAVLKLPSSGKHGTANSDISAIKAYNNYSAGIWLKVSKSTQDLTNQIAMHASRPSNLSNLTHLIQPTPLNTWANSCILMCGVNS
jgi:hypothetical protein